MANFDGFEMEKRLVQMKHEAIACRKTFTTKDLVAFKSELLGLANDIVEQQTIVEKMVKKDMAHLKMTSYGTGIALIIYLLTAFLGAPLWAQVVVLLLLAALIIITVYILMRSGDPFGNLLRLVQLIKEIWAIINDITPTPSHDCPAGQHWDEAQGKCVADTPPVSETPPGMVFEPFGDITLNKIGGEHQVDMPVALAGGNGWKGLTVKVMSPDDPTLDVLPNYIWAFWYDGQYAVPGWMISKQGYYYKDNPITDENCIHSIVPTPWIQPGDVLATCVPLYLTETIKKEDGKLIFHMKNGKRMVLV